MNNKINLALALGLSLGAVASSSADVFHLRVHSPGLVASANTPPTPAPVPPPPPKPASAVFGDVAFGAVNAGSSTSLSFTVQNASADAALELQDIAVAGPGLSWAPGAMGTPCAGSMPQTLAPKASCSLTVTWSPAAAGPLVGGQLTVTDNAPESPHRYDLTGTAGTAPDPHFANVSLLLPFEGAGDIKGNALSFIGAASTTQAAHTGTRSVYFAAGIGQVLKVDNAALGDFPGDFTIEGWTLPLTNTAFHVFDMGGVDQLNWQSQGLWVANGRFIYNASSANTTNDIAANLDIGAAVIGQWNHFAITRNGAVYRTFVNGKLTKTVAVNKRPYKPLYGLVLGNYPYKTWTSFPNSFGAHHTDDFRVTNGVARYTADFVPSNQPYPTR